MSRIEVEYILNQMAEKRTNKISGNFNGGTFGVC